MMRVMRIFDEYITDNVRRSKKQMLIFVCFLAGGFLFGLIFGTRGIYADIMFADSMHYALRIFTGQTGFFTLIFRGVLINAQFFLLIFIFSLSVYLAPLNYLFFCYKGYVYGAAVTVFTRTLGMGGFATAMILVLPQQLILMAALCLYICHCNRWCRRRACFSERAAFLFKTAIIFFLFSLINIVVEIAVVYVIIKPFHIII